MIWIAPSEKDCLTEPLEIRLWGSADQSRTNSELTAQDYSWIFRLLTEVIEPYHGRILDDYAGQAGLLPTALDANMHTACSNLQMLSSLLN